MTRRKLNIRRHRIALVVAVLIAAATASFLIQPISSASAATYTPLKAIQYAEQWWNKRNPKFQHYGFNDCANFVSQCLIAGGLNLRARGTSDRSGSIAQCDSLDTYLTKTLKATVWKKSRGQVAPSGLQPGDVAIFGNWWGLRHAVFVVAKQANGQPLFDAHTFDRHKTTLDWLFTAWTYVKYYHIVKTPLIMTAAATKPKTPAKVASKPSPTKLLAAVTTNVASRSTLPATEKTENPESSASSAKALTGAVSQIASTGATLTGTVKPNGTPTRWFFEYGTSTAYDMATEQQGPLLGNMTYEISADLTGLRSGALYHARLVTMAPDGTLTAGNDVTFTTLDPTRSSTPQD